LFSIARKTQPQELLAADAECGPGRKPDIRLVD
jgi:hypothetical protein